MLACRRSDELCAVGCVDWVTGHAEEKRDDLILTLERPQLRGEPPQAAAASVGGAKHCKPSVLGRQSQSQISSHAALDFGGAASDVFRTKRDKGVGRLRKFTAFCIENGISLACSLSLSHPSSKSQTPKAKKKESCPFEISRASSRNSHRASGRLRFRG